MKKHRKANALSDEPPIAEIEPQDFAPTRIVDLDQWLVLVAEAEPTDEPEPTIVNQAREIETAEAAWALPAFYFARASQAEREVEEVQLALDFG